MSNINITISLDEADRQRFDRLIAALERGATTAPAPAETAPVPSAAPVAAVEEHPADVVPVHAEPAPKPEEAAKSEAAVSVDDLRALVRKLAAPGSPVGSQKVKAIVQQYAASVREIPEDKRSEVFAALKALEANA